MANNPTDVEQHIAVRMPPLSTDGPFLLLQTPPPDRRETCEAIWAQLLTMPVEGVDEVLAFVEETHAFWAERARQAGTVGAAAELSEEE